MNLPQFDIPQMASSRASLVFSLCTDTLFDDVHRLATYAKDDSYGLCPTTSLPNQAPRLRLRPRPRSLSLVSDCTSTLSSSSAAPLEDHTTWFDETPRRSHFILDEDDAISDEHMSPASFEATSQWFDESDPAASPLDDAIPPDAITFPPSPSSSLNECSGGHAPLPSDSEDTESLRTIDSDRKLILDEQLLRSPTDSFAAMCWDTTEDSFEKRKSHLDCYPKLAELRLSRLYGVQAQAYEEGHSTEGDRLAHVDLPHMRFTQTSLQPQIASSAYLITSRALPCLAPVSKKAAKVLDLPCDMTVIPTLLDMPTFSTSQSRHRRAITHLPRDFAGKWKRAVKSLSPL